MKVRLQTSSHSQFSSTLDCLAKTIRNEGILALYKGATPPLVGWVVMDSVMLGSFTAYRKFIHNTLYSSRSLVADTQPEVTPSTLPTIYQGLAGLGAGWTVSFIAAPVEHLKARLQIQYAAEKSQRLYRGPIDCAHKIYRSHGIPGLYHGLTATLIFRSFFFFYWASYHVFTRTLRERTRFSEPAVNFLAGGLAGQVFWIFSYPSDVIKQRIMTDPLGKEGKYKNWRAAASLVGKELGPRGIWRGFLPCFLRAFPANAAALSVFEAVIRILK